jgi:LacI family transcriptional regulator
MDRTRVGIRDVAREANVSITTVSRALNGYDDVNEETKKRIFKVVEQLRYAPNVNARSMGGIHQIVIALLISGLSREDDSGFVFGMISGMHKVASEHNCESIILTTDTQSQSTMSYLQLCRQKNVDGVLISGLNNDDPYYKELMNSEIPCVVVEGEFHSRNVSGLSIDNEMASYEAVRYLIELGHDKIGMMNGKASADVAIRRQKGYRQALRNSGIDLDDSWIYDGQFLKEEAYEQAKRMLSEHPDMSAVFCASDLMAIGVIEAIKEKGLRVPEDISVIGFDDIPLARYIEGGLTTIRQPFYDMTVKGVEALYQMVTNKRSYDHIYAPYEFVKRKTVAAHDRSAESLTE